MLNAEQTADTIDSLITTDIGVRGAIQPLLDSSQQQSSHSPILDVSNYLDATLTPKDTVLVATGFPIPPTMQPETDGPPGATALADLLVSAFDTNVIICTEPTGTDVCRVAAETHGLLNTNVPSEKTRSQVTIESFPTDQTEAKQTAETLAEHDLSAIIAVEKAGPNTAGVYHNMRGIDVSANNAKLDELLALLPETPLLAIGDGGNELGMRDIAQPVKHQIPYGETCQCPCAEGIICDIPATHAVPAAVSNWGAYGIITMTSILHDTNYLHQPSTEETLLEAISSAGAVDGINGGTTGWCDALPPAVHTNIIDLLHTIIDNAELTSP